MCTAGWRVVLFSRGLHKSRIVAEIVDRCSSYFWEGSNCTL